MKKFLFIFILSFLVAFLNAYTQESITIFRQVPNYEGIIIGSSIVRFLSLDFEDVAITYFGKNGFYKQENLGKDKMAMYVMRLKEYPHINTVPERNMRNKFWALNIIADRGLTINPHCQKLELYGTAVFMSLGAYPGLFIYFRPMSLTKSLSYSKDIYRNKKGTEKHFDFSIKPSHLKAKIFADSKELKRI